MATYGNTALDPVADKLRQVHTIPDLGNHHSIKLA